MSLFWLKSGYTVKYSLSPQEIPRDFLLGSRYILLYIPTLITTQIQYGQYFKAKTTTKTMQSKFLDWLHFVVAPWHYLLNASFNSIKISTIIKIDIAYLVNLMFNVFLEMPKDKTNSQWERVGWPESVENYSKLITCQSYKKLWSLICRYFPFQYFGHLLSFTHFGCPTQSHQLFFPYIGM